MAIDEHSLRTLSLWKANGDRAQSRAASHESDEQDFWQCHDCGMEYAADCASDTTNTPLHPVNIVS
jgi:hypothetical protein